jgi:hypothetical protein
MLFWMKVLRVVESGVQGGRLQGQEGTIPAEPRKQGVYVKPLSSHF